MVKLTYKCDLCGKDIVTLDGYDELPYGKGYYRIEIHTDEYKSQEYEICEDCLKKIKSFMNGIITEGG